MQRNRRSWSINNYRAQNGPRRAEHLTNLTRAALARTDMARRTILAHRFPRAQPIPARTTAATRRRRRKHRRSGAWQSAQSAFTAWRNSSGHNANMLHASYRQIGIARVYTNNSTYGWYWVTNFGTTNDGTSGGGGGTTNPTPTPTQPPASTPAAISSPSNGATLPGASANFTWQGVSGASEYFIYAGTSQGSNSITGRSTGTGTSAPFRTADERQHVHVRLWTRFG